MLEYVLKHTLVCLLFYAVNIVKYNSDKCSKKLIVLKSLIFEEDSKLEPQNYDFKEK